ncbi:hypothetical protein HDU98_008942 [Podochytrium sp. JEL0797]|nr:hypothetical protein HDU98_008942 [Podochytrium sp. JEL0797]
MKIQSLFGFLALAWVAHSLPTTPDRSDAAVVPVNHAAHGGHLFRAKPFFPPHSRASKGHTSARDGDEIDDQIDERDGTIPLPVAYQKKKNGGMGNLQAPKPSGHFVGSVGGGVSRPVPQPARRGKALAAKARDEGNDGGQDDTDGIESRDDSGTDYQESELASDAQQFDARDDGSDQDGSDSEAQQFEARDDEGDDEWQQFDGRDDGSNSEEQEFDARDGGDDEQLEQFEERDDGSDSEEQEFDVRDDDGGADDQIEARDDGSDSEEQELNARDDGSDDEQLEQFEERDDAGDSEEQEFDARDDGGNDDEMQQFEERDDQQIEWDSMQEEKRDRDANDEFDSSDDANA